MHIIIVLTVYRRSKDSKSFNYINNISIKLQIKKYHTFNMIVKENRIIILFFKINAQYKKLAIYTS